MNPAASEEDVSQTGTVPTRSKRQKPASNPSGTNAPAAPLAIKAKSSRSAMRYTLQRPHKPSECEALHGNASAETAIGVGSSSMKRKHVPTRKAKEALSP
jgi:hypothetical protein